MSQYPSNQQAISPLFLIAIMGCIALALLTGVWLFLHSIISYYTIYWKWIEAMPFSWIPGLRSLVERMLASASNASNLSFLDLMLAIYPTSLIWTPIPIYLSWRFAKTAYSHPLRKAKRLHTPQSLMEAQVVNFSAIAPIIDRDLTRENPPEWRSSEDPDTYAQQNRLVRSDKTFDREKAHSLLVEQLGPLHDNNPRAWKPHEQALFAVFCDAIFNEEKGFADAEKVIDALNYSARNKKHLPNFSVANELWKKWLPQVKLHKDLRDVMQRHRYVRTLLYALLYETTDVAYYEHTNKGVFNAAQFIWLKPTDRALFYPLHNVGMKVAEMESAAVFEQYRNEILAWDNACILEQPALDQAIIGWEEELFRCGLLKNDPRSAGGENYDIHA